MSWATGGGRYQTLQHCMGGDTTWVAAIVLGGVLVSAAYLVIAWRWWQASILAPDAETRLRVRLLLFIFVFCAFCGYATASLSVVWPAYRLKGIAIWVLAAFSWAYAWRLRRDRAVVFGDPAKVHMLRGVLEETAERLSGVDMSEPDAFERLDSARRQLIRALEESHDEQ